MKKWLYGIILLLLLGYGIVLLQQEGAVERKGVLLYTDETLPQVPDNKQKSLTIDREEMYRGDLVLVNLQYPVHESAKPSHVINLFENQRLLSGFGVLDNSIEMPMDMLQRFVDMGESAKADGVNQFLITSGYRNDESQAALYEQYGSEYANPPGHSEHNLGLSIDIGSSLGLMKDAPEGKWLENNAWQHGFVLRYPEDKRDITGIQYEPWHFRYVGIPHSAIMMDRGFVLEEYLTFLKKRSRVQAEYNGKLYTVSYYPFHENEKLSVPIDGSYSLSGNNMDGVIVTTMKSINAFPVKPATIK
ncbi:M15 family metallopeptidase [Paenibacillus sp. J5C_2022]|uniref:M15 family metallopeptidase n=1 Tax=Paenibacillus sp. J5C2022 TaxID=2977129 RepID=UPI0021CF6042|nr:M15 family metallopeptidase [Paenibacillus sp. J5C2022]MCU6709970.1 M15 family metallopeptidase [Paenibacillus sp. J5C2022]